MPKSDEKPLTEDAILDLWNKKFLPSIRDEISKQLSAVREDVKRIEERCLHIEKSQQFLADKYESLSESLRTNKKLIEATSNNVRKHGAFIEDNQEDINKLYLLLDEMEQYSRRDCLEISGIPKTSDEDAKKLISEIGTITGVNIKEDDISIAHRLPDRKNSKDRLIVKFVKRETKDNLYSARSKLIQQSTRNLPSRKEAHTKPSRIYINESLTGYRKKLLGKINTFKKEHGYKFLWTANGKIYLKKDVTSQTCGPFTDEGGFEEFTAACK